MRITVTEPTLECAWIIQDCEPEFPLLTDRKRKKKQNQPGCGSGFLSEPHITPFPQPNFFKPT